MGGTEKRDRRFGRLGKLRAIGAGSAIALVAPLGFATVMTVTATPASTAPVTLQVSGDAAARNLLAAGALTFDGTDFDALKTLITTGSFSDATFTVAAPVTTITDIALADIDVFFSSAVGGGIDGPDAGTSVDYGETGYSEAEEQALLRFVQRGGVLIANTNSADFDVTRFLGDNPAPAGGGQVAVADPPAQYATGQANECVAGGCLSGDSAPVDAVPIATALTTGVTGIRNWNTFTTFTATSLPDSATVLFNYTSDCVSGTAICDDGGAATYNNDVPTARPVVAFVPFGTAQFGGGAVFMTSDSDTFSDSASGSLENFDLAENILGYIGEHGSQGFTSLTPTRIYDTRSGIGTTAGKVTGATGRDIQVTGVGGVPTGATVVALNLTATNQDGAGFLTAYPTGQAKPNTSNLNIPAGFVDTANAVVVQIGAGGKVTVFNENNATDVVVDVTGYWSPTSPGLLVPTAPARIFDTRNNIGTTGGPLGEAETRAIQVIGVGGVPLGATGVAVNVTATNGTRGGFLTVHDTTTVPNASNVNFLAGANRPNLVFADLAPDGTVRVTNAFGRTDVIFDVMGYFTTTGGSTILPFGPKRVLDTRNAIGAAAGKVASNGRVELTINGDGTAPEGATSVLLNVTVDQPAAAGFLTVHPETSLPDASNVNFVLSQTVPNLVLGRVGTDGKIRITNTSPGTSHVIADVFAWF